jgi:hypothetical protein
MNALEGRISLATVFLKHMLKKQADQDSLDSQNLQGTINILNELLTTPRR